ncbi:MAG: hypothetical protein J5852_07830, partial [Clostridia bacterium]|nr:hypothetical protein [Clostridia bacterium]
MKSGCQTDSRFFIRSKTNNPVQADTSSAAFGRHLLLKEKAKRKNGWLAQADTSSAAFGRHLLLKE